MLLKGYFVCDTCKREQYKVMNQNVVSRFLEDVPQFEMKCKECGWITYFKLEMVKEVK